MNYNTFNNKIISFIEKYPFFADSIVLFRTNDILKTSDFLNWRLDVKYPEIEKVFEKILVIESELDEIEKEFQNVFFGDLYYKKEYFNRLNDFKKVIEIIKIFYNENEEKKFNLINEYFWVDIIRIWKILENKNFYIDYFKNNSSILPKEKIEELENTLIEAGEIKFYFEEALKYLKLDCFWKVKIWDATSIIHTNFNKLWWEIIIPKTRQISIKKLLELIIHEIDWHCVQFSNAEWLFSWSINFLKARYY